MELQEYVDNIKLELTGGVLELEVDDETLGKIVKRSLQEVQRFIDSTELITVPFARKIDLKDSPVSSVIRIFRTETYSGSMSEENPGSAVDPMQIQTFMAFTNMGTLYNLQDYMYNYMSYNTALQLRNTVSTDLAFKYDKQTESLYINTSFDKPPMITIEYVPKFTDVDQIKSDYWIDILQRLSIAQTKVILGRVRSRYTQSNALWTQDGETMLNEGNEEIRELREILRVNSQIIFPFD